MKKYLAEFRYGGPCLMSFEVEKETDKTYVPVRDSEKAILDWAYVGRRLNKDDGNVFDDPASGLAWLIERNKEYIAHLHKKIAVGEANGANLAELLAKFEAQQEGDA